ncbi:hypothetical protein PAMP_025118 [Pampus punctatissimus]
MIGRADIEGSKSDVAMNAWPPQASYPCGNFSDTSCLKPKSQKDRVPPQSNSPPATVPGAGHARRGRALDTRSESPLGARLPASPVGFPWSAPVLSQLLGASRGDPPGPRANGGPTGAVAGEIREKGPARVQSRRRRPPYPAPPPTRPPPGGGHRPAKPPARRRARRRGRGARETGRAPSFRRGREEGDGATAPPAAARAQPRFAPQPDRPSP